MQRQNIFVIPGRFDVLDQFAAGRAASGWGRFRESRLPGLMMAILGRLFAVLAALVLAGSVAGTAQAQDGLTMIRSEAAGGAAELFLSLDELRAMPQVTVNTANDYKDGVNAYTGPLVRDVLSQIGRGTGTKVKLTAANDYSVEIDIREFDDYDVIFALDMNGEAFSLRDLGPIWVMYPITDNAELQDPLFNSRLIWQLVRLEIL